MFPSLLFTLELINARWPSLSQGSFLPAIWEDVRWNRGGGWVRKPPRGLIPPLLTPPTPLTPASFQSRRGCGRGEARQASTAAAAGTGEPWRWAPRPPPSPPPPRRFRPRGGALPTPRSARSRRALGPRRAALRCYKRPRSGPTRNPRLRPVPASLPRWTRRRTGRYAADASPGPARDARPGALVAGSMGAAHSASEEVRELVGKTGCEYSAGTRARGLPAPAARPAARRRAV